MLQIYNFPTTSQKSDNKNEQIKQFPKLESRTSVQNPTADASKNQPKQNPIED